MLSSKLISEQLSHYGEQTLQCPVYISRGIRDPENQRVLKLACALLNSGGGLLHMHNVEHSGKVQSKDLDTWWSGMESNLADILSGDDLCNYFDFVGNFDDLYLFLFVKTAEHLCTINYHCRLPTDTATHAVTYASAVKLLGKSGEVSPLSELPAIPTEYKYGQIEETLKQEGKQIQFKLLSVNKEQGKSFADKVCYFSIKYISAFANHYGGHIYFGVEDSTSAVMGEELDADLEAKIANRIQRMMKDFIWGEMGKHPERGTHWDIQFYPVTDCPNNERRRVLVMSVCKFPGGVFINCPQSYIVRRSVDGIQSVEQLTFSEWKSEMLNHSRVRPELQSRFVKVPLNTPFSRLVYTLPHTQQAARDRVLKYSTGFNLHPRPYLETVSDAQLVSCIKRVLATFDEELHLALALQCWRTRLTSPGHEDLRSTVLILSQHYGMHLVLFVTSHLNSDDIWKLAKTMALEVKAKLVQQGGCADRLAIKIHLLSLGDPLVVENFQVAIDSFAYPPTYLLTEAKLENLLTSLVVIIASYIPCQPRDTSPLLSSPNPLPPTPNTVTQAEELSTASPASPLVTKSAADDDIYYLQTCDQLELLWMRQYTKELWIHGPPGAGKTVAALEMIRELVARGCNHTQLLYIAENPLLCAYIRSFGLCKVVSRRELMEHFSVPQSFVDKYKEVKNVIVDEAQNFKDRDGDWYSVAEQLTTLGAENMVLTTLEADSMVLSTADATAGKKVNDDNQVDDLPNGEAELIHPASSNSQGDIEMSVPNSTSSSQTPSKMPRFSKNDWSGGYFWVFMDYAQKVHKFQAGLPGLIGKNNFMLSEISRNSKEIFDYAMKFMGGPKMAATAGNEFVTDVPVLGHSYESGKAVEVVKCDKDSVHRTLFAILESYLGSGLKPEDIAILVSKRSEKVALEQSISQDVSEKAASGEGAPPTSAVTVDTVRGFSGMDKSVVIGLEPHADENHADLDKFIINLATRAKDGLVIITTSEEVMQKLRCP